MKALWNGKPMVLIPWGRDQPGVAARAQALGVAEVVPRTSATVESIGTAINQVLGSNSMRERAVSYSARLRATDPPREAEQRLATLA
jgi:UDP:flavonoid glycosyltransferase YjiC (YdhE family)